MTLFVWPDGQPACIPDSWGLRMGRLEYRRWRVAAGRRVPRWRLRLAIGYAMLVLAAGALIAAVLVRP